MLHLRYEDETVGAIDEIKTMLNEKKPSKHRKNILQRSCVGDSVTHKAIYREKRLIFNDERRETKMQKIKELKKEHNLKRYGTDLIGLGSKVAKLRVILKKPKPKDQ